MIQLSTERPRRIELDVPAGVTYAYSDLMDVVRAAVSSSGVPLKVLAHRIGEKDETALSRKLSANEKDNTNFPLKKLPDLIEALGGDGAIIVQWLVMRFLVTPDERQAQGAQVIMNLLPLLAQAMKDCGYEVKKI
jgi:hypothetical protein